MEIFRFIRNTSSVADFATRVSSLEQHEQDVTNAISEQLDSIQTIATAQNQVLTSIVAELAASTYSGTGQAVISLESIVGGLSRGISLDLTSVANSLKNDISSRIAAESSLRLQTSVLVQALLTTANSSLTTSFSASNSARVSFKALMSSERSNLVATMSTSFSSQTSTESSRALFENTTFLSQALVTSNFSSLQLSSSIQTEARRADSACISTARSKYTTAYFPSNASDWNPW